MKEVSSSQLQACCNAGPLLIVVSGPSGVGKDAILSHMKALGCPFEYITTMTTRAPRITEKVNIDYHFVSAETFKSLRERGELLEYACVYSNWYGVPRQPVKQALEKGRDTIIKVDIQGAATIKKLVPEAIFIFIAPPSLDELLSRLKQRRTESACDLDLRTRAAEAEMKQLHNFDYVVVNPCDGIDSAISQIKAIVSAEKCRVKPRAVKL